MQQKIDRISFHFNDKCPHRCGFCYMPFDRRGVGNLSQWLKILDRVADFEPDLVSFAGGDPLVYTDFYKLIGAMKKRSYVNLITTGYFLRKDLYSEVCHNIDSISLALDEVPADKKVQRYSKRQFERFASILSYVDKIHNNITINTLVTPKNRDQLHGIGEFLIQQGLTRVHWNLYRFWAFDFIERGQEYLLEGREFDALLTELQRGFSGILDIQGWHPDDRKKGYFFVTSLGIVYTVDKNNVNKYAFLGSIFDEDIYDQWLEHNCPADVKAKYHVIVDREIEDRPISQ